MKRLGMPVSDDTILRHLKRQVARFRAKTTVRVAGIDDWSWQKGRTYGTIIVDLERREVVDVLQDRTTAGTAEWLGQHPEIEIVSRDRCGLYAQGAREGAPQARQVADRFHLLQNLRETIETQLSCAVLINGPRTIATVSRAVDPATGWTISPIVAASLCIKPRGLLTPSQAAKVDALKSASASPCVGARHFRGILRSKDI